LPSSVGKLGNSEPVANYPANRAGVAVCLPEVTAHQDAVLQNDVKYLNDEQQSPTSSVYYRGRSLKKISATILIRHMGPLIHVPLVFGF